MILKLTLTGVVTVLALATAGAVTRTVVLASITSSAGQM